MKFSEIINRLNGISTPLGGLSWETSELAVSVARRVIGYLEDRRVLYAPSELEVPSHCVDSVLQIRRFLTEELTKLGHNSELAASLRAMRAACRKLLQVTCADRHDVMLNATYSGNWASWEFYSAVGEMRGTFGVQLARIAAEFKLDVEDDLAAILPARDEDD